MRVVTVEERQVCIGGIGKMYFQDGLPIEITADILTEKGIEVSWYHIVDELIRNGWNNVRVTNTLTPILKDSKHSGMLDTVINYINQPYEKQREIIFKYLFGSEQTAKNWFYETYK
jgi:hypothetical protein